MAFSPTGDDEISRIHTPKRSELSRSLPTGPHPHAVRFIDFPTPKNGPAYHRRLSVWAEIEAVRLARPKSLKLMRRGDQNIAVPKRTLPTGTELSRGLNQSLPLTRAHLAELVADSLQLAALTPPGCVFVNLRGKTERCDTSFITMRRYRRDWTILIEGIERYCWSFHQLASRVAAQWGATFGRANVYISPPGAPPGFKAHTDPGRGIVYQLSGKKEWLLGPVVPNSIGWVGRLEDFELAAEPEFPDETARKVLCAGDNLLVSAGQIHSAKVTGSEPSIHVTVALGEPTERDLLAHAAELTFRGSDCPPSGLPRYSAEGNGANLLDAIADILNGQPGRQILEQSLAAKYVSAAGSRGHWLQGSTPSKASIVRWTGVAARASGNRLILSPGIGLAMSPVAMAVVERLIRSGDGLAVGDEVAPSEWPEVREALIALNDVGAIEVNG